MIEFDLRILWHRLIRGWKTPLVLAVIMALFTISTLPGSKPVYSVHMLIMPAPSDQATTGSAGGTLSALLGLTGNAQASNYVRYQNLMFSNAVAQRMQNRYGMLQYVFRASWDAKNQRWIQTYTFRDRLTGWLLRLANIPTWSPPDVTAMAKFLKAKLTVMPVTGTDMLDISMNDPDVTYATRILLAANEEANAVLRDQVARRATLQVAYLQRKLAQTSVEDYRQTLLALLSSEEKTLMLTQTDAPYAAEIISPPIAAPQPVAPRPVLSLFVAILTGIIVGCGITIFFGADWLGRSLAWLRAFPRRQVRGRAVAARR